MFSALIGTLDAAPFAATVIANGVPVGQRGKMAY
jgi:hypothetical protein